MFFSNRSAIVETDCYCSPRKIPEDKLPVAGVPPAIVGNGGGEALSNLSWEGLTQQCAYLILSHPVVHLLVLLPTKARCELRVNVRIRSEVQLTEQKEVGAEEECYRHKKHESWGPFGTSLAPRGIVNRPWSFVGVHVAYLGY